MKSVLDYLLQTRNSDFCLNLTFDHVKYVNTTSFLTAEQRVVGTDVIETVDVNIKGGFVLIMGNLELDAVTVD